MPDVVNHPTHYGGENNPYEAIKVIEAWGLGFCLGNVIKYICRAGKKTFQPKNASADDWTRQASESMLEDLKKARWYLNREIEALERQPTADTELRYCCSKCDTVILERHVSYQANQGRHYTVTGGSVPNNGALRCPRRECLGALLTPRSKE